MGNKVTLKDGLALDLPYIQVGVMGEPGSGKSRFAATFPTGTAEGKAMLVIATDPLSKMQPYFDRGHYDGSIQSGAFGQDICLVRNDEGKVIIQVEGFYDVDATMVNSAMTNMVNRITASVTQEAREGKWATIVLDSWSGFEDAASYRRLHGPLKCNNPDGRAHRAIAKEDCKSIFLHSLVNGTRGRCNLVFTYHTTKFAQEQGGEVQYTMQCIGDFATTVGRNLAERYHSVSLPDGVTRQLYTKPDGRFKLATLIDAPSPCDNTFGALWGPYIEKEKKRLEAMKATKPAGDASTPATTAAGA